MYTMPSQVIGQFSSRYQQTVAPRYQQTATPRYQQPVGIVLGARRLILLASDCADKADFLATLKPNVQVAEFDVETATAVDIIHLIAIATERNLGQPFASAALAGHGGVPWRISNSVVVSDAAKMGDDAMAVMKALGKATVPARAGGRVDLFACSLLATPEGRAVFKAIQQETDAHFAASDDLTGNVKAGKQDWVMESDGVNIKPLYFRADTSAFDGNFVSKDILLGPPNLGTTHMVPVEEPATSFKDYQARYLSSHDNRLKLDTKQPFDDNEQPFFHKPLPDDAFVHNDAARSSVDQDLVSHSYRYDWVGSGGGPPAAPYKPPSRPNAAAEHSLEHSQAMIAATQARMAPEMEDPMAEWKMRAYESVPPKIGYTG